MMPMETADELEGSGAENGPGGAVAVGGATSDATSEGADTAGVGGGGHGAEKGTRRRLPAGQKTRPASPSEWEKDRGVSRPPEWQKPPGGLPGSGRGGRVYEGHQHPRSGRVAPGERNLLSDPRG